MNRNNSIACIILLIIATLISLTSASAQTEIMQGSFVFVPERSGDIERAIETATAKMNFLIKPLARSRLREITNPHQRIHINFTDTEVELIADDLPSSQTPLNGSSVLRRQDNGDVVYVSTLLDGGVLRQTLTAKNGQCLTEFTLSPIGQYMIVHVTIISPQLNEPVKYTAVYRKLQEQPGYDDKSMSRYASIPLK